MRPTTTRAIVFSLLGLFATDLSICRCVRQEGDGGRIAWQLLLMLPHVLNFSSAFLGNWNAKASKWVETVAALGFGLSAAEMFLPLESINGGNDSGTLRLFFIWFVELSASVVLFAFVFFLPVGRGRFEKKGESPKLVYEIWKEVVDGVPIHICCLAGPRGNAQRYGLRLDAQLLTTFEAASHFEAMSFCNAFFGREAYTSDQLWEYEPYPAD